MNIFDEYKYLGLLESDDFNSERIKIKAKSEYKKRLRLILKSKLHGRNQITAINTFALSVLTYPAGVIKFTIQEKKIMGTMTEKQFTMHGSLHHVQMSIASMSYGKKRDEVYFQLRTP